MHSSLPKGTMLALLMTGVWMAAVCGLMFPQKGWAAHGMSCRHPSLWSAQACREMEEEILQATAQVSIEVWRVREDESGYDVLCSCGHATVKEGSFLVTHNHHSVPLSIRLGEEDVYESVVISNAAGERLFRAPLTDFEVEWEDAGAMVLGYKDEGLFEELGFRSAEFGGWPAEGLGPGAEVAQVDWDGSETRVDWVTVEELKLEGDLPRLVMGDDVMAGASGGGVFFHGAHIATNWLVVEELSGSGELIERGAVAALDSEEIVGRMGAGR